MATFEIKHDCVTGINGAGYTKGQKVDASVFHEASISNLVAVGAISEVKEKAKPEKQE
jgi:hypothetical protein